MNALLSNTIDQQVKASNLQSALATIVIDGQVVATAVRGDAITGVPATIDGNFRNGAVAISYISTTLLKMSEDGLIDLDTPISSYLPDLPEGANTTSRMLINMTAGYPDFVPVTQFLDKLYADPFRPWTPEEIIAISLAQPRSFEPGKNWAYSHSDIMVLGRVMEKAAGRPLGELIKSYVLDPLELTHTQERSDAVIPEPVIHGFTGERGIFEDSTYWNPSWTLPTGSVETSTIGDIAKSFDAILGNGRLISNKSYQEMIAPTLIGFGSDVPGCATCHTLDSNFSYGLGVILTGDWAMQTPLFSGYQSVALTLPAERAPNGKSVTVVAAFTLNKDSYPNWNTEANFATLFAKQIATAVVPDNAPPKIP